MPYDIVEFQKVCRRFFHKFHLQKDLCKPPPSSGERARTLELPHHKKVFRSPWSRDVCFNMAWPVRSWDQQPRQSHVRGSSDHDPLGKLQLIALQVCPFLVTHPFYYEHQEILPLDSRHWISSWPKNCMSARPRVPNSKGAAGLASPTTRLICDMIHST